MNQLSSKVTALENIDEVILEIVLLPATIVLFVKVLYCLLKLYQNHPM